MVNSAYLRRKTGFHVKWGLITFLEWMSYMSPTLQQLLGALLALFILADVFYTVLYARIGAGILSYRVARGVWILFRGASRPFGKRRGQILSLGGPSILIVLLVVWACLLTLGMALVIHPALGQGVTASSGTTPTDFVSALYAAGASMSIVGGSNFSPHTGAFRLLYLFNSLVGMSVISLTLTYLMQVYTALLRRNATALAIDLGTGETGDAAELIAGMAPEGQFSSGYTNLSEIAAEMVAVKETHHFYPVLFYFRFPEPAYSVSRASLVSLDTVTLIKAGLSNSQYGWVKESSAVTQLWRACLHLTTGLAETFIPDDLPSREQPDKETRERWRHRYQAALRRLRQAGIETVEDERAGAEEYIELRSHWHSHINALAPALAYNLEEVDTEGANPEASDHRLDFRGRRHSAG
jgi:hypothetical protein